MIYTITLNPAIDRILIFDKFMIGTTNRSIKEIKYAAGKGIHVSKLLTNIGAKNQALYSCGQDDDWFQYDLKQQKLNAVPFMSPNGQIRENLKLIDQTSQTECNAIGITINPQTLEQMQTYLQTKIKPDDIIVISGSLPPGLSQMQFINFVAKLNTFASHFVFDLSNIDALIALAKFKPLLIKPNENEYQEIRKRNYNVAKLLALGVQNIFLSQGDKGGILYNKHSCEKIFLNKKFNVVNQAGSGDSFIGGFTAMIDQGKSVVQAAKFGVICGTATATSARIANLTTINKVAKELKWKLD